MPLRIAVTSGEPAGIGPELCLRLAGRSGAAQPVVIGDRRKFLSCLIVPNFEKLREWATKNGLGALSDEELVAHPRVEQIYQGIVDRWNEGKPNEQLIHAFKLLPKELTIEGGELTPTLKVKRRIVDQKFRSVIDGLYKGD